MHELTFTTDPRTQTPRMIYPRPGVNVSLEEFWRRYAPIFRIPPSELVQAGSARPSSTRRGYTTTFYQQVHLGFPVAGYGYAVDSERGLFRAALGKVMPALPDSLPKPIDRAAALEIVVRYLKLPGPPPWVTNPGSSHAPEGWLVLSTGRVSPVGSDFILTWVFNLAGTGLSEPRTMEINAVTGAVLLTSPGRVR